MGIVFCVCIIMMAIISFMQLGNKENPKGLEVDRSMFKVNKSFAVGSIIIIGILTALYTFFW
jgi:SSS family solute:Na+ symporter